MFNKVRKNRRLRKIRLFKRQEVWILTFQGWLAAIAVMMSLVVTLIVSITNVHSFLAPTVPLKTANILVVEGWLPDYALKEAVSEFNQGSYKFIATTGGALEMGTNITGFQNFADVSAATLKKLGLSEDKIVAVSAPEVVKDRSFQSAATFATWLEKSQLNINSINLLSLGAHTRRSWYLYQKILEPKIKVGIITAHNRDYNPDKWWTTSSGVRDVIDEGVAFIYARYIHWNA
jgi:hypothetical protein